MNSLNTQPVVMQIIPELGAGGAEQGCIDVAAALIQNGAQSIVVSHGGSRIHELDRAGAVHIELPVHKKSPFALWKNIKALRKIIQRYNVDIVHARSRAPAWSAWKACEGTSARFMTTCHAPYNINGSAKRFYNSSITKGERIIAISHTVSDYLQSEYGVPKDKIRMIHRGIGLDKFHPTAVTPHRLISLTQDWRIPDGANVIMLPGRITRWKGHHVLIEAMSILKRKDLFCIIIGSDQGRTEYRQELEKTIQEKRLGNQIRIVEHCNDMPAAYMLASVAVSASTDPEGFGRIPVEAQAMGRPVIGTNHGGARETIIHGQTGWLVEPNDPQELALAIEDILRLDDNQRAMLATRAMSHVAENFTRELMTSKTLQVYSELLGQSINLPQSRRASLHNKSNFERVQHAAE